MEALFLSSLAIIGISMGSFAGAQVWRFRARQLEEDSRAGEPLDKSELKRLKPLLGKTLRSDRSQCLSCHHALGLVDMIPVISWLALGGRCRYCRSPIGWTELLLEVSMGLLFVLSVAFWPTPLITGAEWIKLVLWLVALVILAINLVYDMRWSLLVTSLNWALISLGVIFAAITAWQQPDLGPALWSLLGAVMVLGGLYGVLWMISKGRWVGEGDIYLGAGLALFLGDWQLAFVALFSANLIGTAVVLPQLLRGALRRGSHLPFGPLLIAGFLVAWFFGPSIIGWYQGIVLLG